MARRDAKGRFAGTNGNTHKTTKGYPRVTAGPLRHQYLHRIVAAALIGRDLTKDEEVDHRDHDRRNFHFSNLIIRGHWDHGWVSAKQSYFMRHRDAKEKAAWDEFMESEAKVQTEAISLSKASGEPWRGIPDGHVEERWQAYATRY